MAVSLTYFVSFFFDPLLIAFWFEPFVHTRTEQYVVAWIFMTNVILTPFTGVKRKELVFSIEEEESI